MDKVKLNFQLLKVKSKFFCDKKCITLLYWDNIWGDSKFMYDFLIAMRSNEIVVLRIVIKYR